MGTSVALASAAAGATLSGLSYRDRLNRTVLVVEFMRNPFQYGAELKPSQIVNRKQELRDVQRAILGHGRLFLLGPRRSKSLPAAAL